MEQVHLHEALSKSEFHRRLHDWLKNTDNESIGPENKDGRTSWIYVHDGSNMFHLHVDTSRKAVETYLQLVAQYGDDLQWEIVESQRGQPTAVVYGPDKYRHTPFYLYLYK